MVRRWTAVVLLVMILMIFVLHGISDGEKQGSVSISMFWNSGDDIDTYLKTGRQIVMSMYRIASQGTDGDADWMVLPVYAGLADQIREIESDLREGKEEAHKIDPVLEEIHTMIQNGNIAPILTSVMDENGVTEFSNLENGIYYTEVSQGPEKLLMQTPLLPIPFTYLGTVTYSIVTKPKLTEITSPTSTPKPTLTPKPTPTDTPEPTPTLTP
ncbi:MAG: hypothetical protein IJ708_11780, partial [Clostridia bacterium]|nr:hypothetical protein [Clostridia bacterium]